MQKTKNNILHKVLLALFIFIMCLVFCATLLFSQLFKSVHAYVDDGTYDSQNISGCSVSDNAVVVSELWDTSGNQFNVGNLQTLMGYIGSLVSSSSTLATNNTNVTSANIRSHMLSEGYVNENDSSTGKDIVITIGGYQWELTYLSKDNEGDVIATLWLADNTLGNQMWQNNWYPSSEDMWGLYYPGNMYSTSYIRALLNGGKYACPYSDTGFATAKTGAITTTNAYFKEYENLDVINPYRSGSWANLNLFTSSNSALSDFIVTPNMVRWQMSESSYLNDVNFNWSAKYTNSNVTAEMYNSWTEDKLWLPSLTETGFNGVSARRWSLSSAQRSNAYYSWLRTGQNSSHVLTLLNPIGGTADNSVYLSRSVRPAFHLNLSDAVLSVLSDADIVSGIIECDNIKYKVANGNAVVNGYTNYIGRNVVIPASINVDETEYVVAGIKDGAFRNASRIRSVRIESETPIDIGTGVFMGCVNLSAIYVPEESVAEYRSAWSAYSSIIDPMPETGIELNLSILLVTLVLGGALIAVAFKRKEQ